MKVFEKRQQDGSRKLMGTMTTVGEATEVTLKTKDGTSSTFDFSKQYHYVAPGSFAVNGTDDALGMYIGDNRVVPPAYIDFEEESAPEVPDTPDDHDTPEPGPEPAPTVTLTAIEVTTPPTKVVYTAGEELDLTGMVVTLTGTDGTQEVTETAGVDEYITDPVNGDTLTTDVTEVVVTAVENNSITDSFTITVNAAPETPDNGNA